MTSEMLEVLLLHEHPEYLNPCCKLINDEWPRSETARMMSLKASCGNLPTSLILILDQKQIIGHCKLTPIPSIPNSCFIETVVIDKSMRGKKLGTFLMQKVEEYCKNILKLDMVHLSTKGQENFYSKLGYKVCSPVSIYGNVLPNYLTSEDDKNKLENHRKCEIHSPESNLPNVSNGQNLVPLPPPMPKPKIINSTLKSNKTFMYKYLK